ncbi:tRNA-dihydrouridine synthase DusB [hydrothermal vent metagenome]|uniref:tRNA-dihydrouridine synthase DusB n=1 Tax=hydrothermal vent metagenome TaxID=652676 RepID=A0A3B0SPP1_9ZZZZ
MTFQLADIQLDNPVFLAPMSGVTDLPFRNLVRKLGAGLVISEMTASEQLATGRKDSLRKITNDTSTGPFVIQLAGREAKWMAEGARIAESAGAQVIDINMGCPSRHVTKGASGSALMRDLDHAMSLVEAVLAAVQVPVSLKMRLGWDHSSLNAPELAARAQAAGIAMITVHGRTRCQFYKGKADWSAVALVREVIDIPLVINGDIGSTADAKTALQQSGADAVMVGRFACGRPWLPGFIANELAGRPALVPSLVQQLEFLLQQFDGSLELYGERLGIRMFRKHIAWSLDAALQGQMPPSLLRQTRADLCRMKDAAQIRDGLRHAFLQTQTLASA